MWIQGLIVPANVRMLRLVAVNAVNTVVATGRWMKTVIVVKN